MLQNSKMKKVVAGFVGVAMTLSLVGGAVTAYAQTATFSRDLTVGSSGADVAALQAILVAGGYLTIPAGVAPGYFGTLTQSAVAKWQANAGISPAAGYFGPISRAKIGGGSTGPVAGVPGCPAGAMFNYMTGAPCSGGSTPSSSPSGSDGNDGDEGQLTNFDELSRLSGEEVVEGEEGEEVLGVEMEAEDSDITLNRVEVEFEMTTAGGADSSDRLDRYVDAVSLMLDGEEIASMDVDEADEDDDVYSFRFNGLDADISEGDLAELVVAVDVSNNIDGDDEGTEWTVTIPEDGIRATDEAGFSDSYDSSEFETTFTVETLSSAGDIELQVSLSNDDSINESHNVEVSDSSDTNDVEILQFEIEADGSDMVVDEIPVFVTASGVADLDLIVNRLTLSWDGGDESETVTTATVTSATTTFEDLGIEIEEGDSVTFTVLADINEMTGTFGNGDSVLAQLRSASEVDAIDAEDANGDTISTDDLNGSAIAESVAFYTQGVSVKVASITEDVSDTSTTETNDRGTYTIRFDVTAFGDDDVYVDSQSGTSTDGVQWSVTGDTFTGSSTSNLTCSGCDEGTGNYLVEAGETETFTLTVVLINTLGAAGFYGVQVDEIGIGTADDATAETTITAGLEDLETEEINLET